VANFVDSLLEQQIAGTAEVAFADTRGSLVLTVAQAVLWRYTRQAVYGLRRSKRTQSAIFFNLVSVLQHRQECSLRLVKLQHVAAVDFRSLNQTVF
jgi:hypothetical protein